MPLESLEKVNRNGLPLSVKGKEGTVEKYRPHLYSLEWGLR
jgi:hypothetical protein